MLFKGIKAYIGAGHNPHSPHPIPKDMLPMISSKLTFYLGFSKTEAKTGITL